jgi:hypothetical protein
MIKPEFWEDTKVAKLSFQARLLYIAIWNIADDEGYLPNDAKWIRNKAFHYDQKVKIDKLITELTQNQMLILQNGIFKVRQFLVHQKIKKPTPSKLAEKWGNGGEVVKNHLPLKEVNGSEEKIKEVNAHAREDEGKGKSGDTPEPPVSSGTNQNDITATAPNDTAEKPMAWNEQSKYAQSLGMSSGLSEQIISIAKENKIILYRRHWEYFAANANMSILMPMLQSLADASKKRSKSGFQHIGSG